MKALVIFDTNFGNTKIIAEAIAKEFGDDTKAISVSDFNVGELEGIDLLVVGSPIIGWKPSERMGKFLASLSLVVGSPIVGWEPSERTGKVLASLNKNQLKGIKAVAFDTRVKVFYHGDAGGKISRKLKDAGAEIIAKPQAFFVQEKEGPLVDGEAEKAAEWARMIKAK